LSVPVTRSALVSPPRRLRFLSLFSILTLPIKRLALFTSCGLFSDKITFHLTWLWWFCLIFCFNFPIEINATEEENAKSVLKAPEDLVAPQMASISFATRMCPHFSLSMNQFLCFSDIIAFHLRSHDSPTSDFFHFVSILTHIWQNLLTWHSLSKFGDSVSYFV
jgi:hypothetical protein